MPQIGNLTGILPNPLQNLDGSGEGSPARPSSGVEVLGLRAGDLVEVGVAEDLGGGEGIVDIGGKLFRASFPEGLSAGARVALRVIDTGPPLLLRTPSLGEESLSRLLSPPATGLAQTVQGLLAAADSPEGGASRSLLQGLEVLRLPQDPADLAPALARLLQKFGLFHEAALGRGEEPQDLKSLALRLLSRSEDPSLTKLAVSLLEHIEAHQARNVLEGVLSFPFTLPWGDEPVSGEWVVEERRGKTPSGQALSGTLRLRLEMPRLGPVEASFRWGGAGNSIRLRVAPSALGAVSDRLPELEQSLLGAAEVRVLELRAEPLVPASAAGRGLLEVTA